MGLTACEVCELTIERGERRFVQIFVHLPLTLTLTHSSFLCKLHFRIICPLLKYIASLCEGREKVGGGGGKGSLL